MTQAIQLSEISKPGIGVGAKPGIGVGAKKRARPFLALALSAALSLPLPILGQPEASEDAATDEHGEVYELEDITLSANLGEIGVNQTGLSVELIEEEEIARANTPSLAEFLGGIPGVSFNRAGPPGGEASVRIRGAQQYESKVLLDGIDLSDPSLPQAYFNFADMGTGGLERIEVLKGAQSVVHGGSSAGGVIHLTSKEAPEEGVAASGAFELGSYETYNSSTSLGHGGARHGLVLNLGRFESEGFSAAEENNGNDETDGLAARQILAKGHYDVLDGVSVGFSAILQASEAEYDDGFSNPVSDADNRAEHEQGALRVYTNIQEGGNGHEIALTYQQADREYTTEFGTGGYASSRKTLSYTGDNEFDETSRIGVKLSHVIEEAEPTGSFGSGKEDTQISSIVMTLDESFGESVDVSHGSRVDIHSAFGRHFSYRLAGAYRPDAQTVLKSALATGFRAPSINELYTPWGGNADLDVEESASAEIGFEYQMDEQSHIGMNIFYTMKERAISYDQTSFTYTQLDGESHRKGFEISGRSAFNDYLAMGLGYTYLETGDADGARLTKIPASELNIAIEAKPSEAANFRLDGKFVGDVLDKDGVALDDYALFNARFGYLLGNSELFLRVENLFDQEYQITRGYGTSDRAFYAGIRVEN